MRKSETVVLPDGLKKIHNDAFSRCTKLNNVTLPESLIKIGNGAFSVCESLESIKIPDYINAALETSVNDSVNGLGTGVFDGCTALSNVTFWCSHDSNFRLAFLEVQKL